MGNEISSIKDYQIGQPFVSNAESPVKFTVAPATHILDNKKYTTFHYSKQRGKLDEAAEKHIEVLCTTRHPYILKYKSTLEESKHMVLITEHVIPLDVAVEQQEKIEIFAGIYNILEALIFLHEKSNICHNAISVSSVYVTDDGVWKLAAFENSSKVLRLSKQSYDNDITGFAEFVLSVLEYLRDDDPLTLKFMQRLEQDFANKEKEVIGDLKSLYNDSFFKFPFLEILDWLEKLPLKEVSEKRNFYGSLATELQKVPSLVVSKRLLPLLFSQFIICDPLADQGFLNNLFTSGDTPLTRKNAIIDEEHYRKFAIPLIATLFESRDRTVRLKLMKYITGYVGCIPKDMLQNSILSELLYGLKDSCNEIVTSTFHALAALVPLLGSDAVVGGERMTCFFDRTPDFTRLPKHGSSSNGLSSFNNVSDVMAPQLNTSSVTNFNDGAAEERRNRRIEREKKRDEQRQRREQRKLERESHKAIRIQSQSSEETSSQPSSTERNISTDFKEESTHDDTNNIEAEHSEPDWEGFEAFSDAEIKDTTTSPSFVSRTNDHWQEESDDRHDDVIFDEKDDEWGWYDKDLSHDNKDVHHSDKTISQSENEDSNQEKTTSVIITPKKVGKGLDLSKTKKIKPNETFKPDNKTNSLNDKPTKTTAKKNDSFETFDIQIDKTKVGEPDYFADMMPSFNDTSSATKTVMIETNIQNTNSKFSALNMDMDEDASGWGDDDGDGWGDDDF